MLTLENRELRVEVLDPIADVARQGTRYCWGGYIWQVHDQTLGPLVSGPEWPEPKPTAFNGQGLPESFRHRSRDGRPLTWRGNEGIAIGIGTLALDAAGNVILAQPCPWTIETTPGSIVFRTAQAAAGISYRLTRTIELNGRTLRSISEVTSHGEAPFELQWFAHPFFALGTEALDLRVELPAGAVIPENAGFETANGALTPKRRFGGGDDGQFVVMTVDRSQPFHTVLRGAGVPAVDFRTSFVPDECPVWGNRATFSIEPYRIVTLQPGQTLSWETVYSFGR